MRRLITSICVTLTVLLGGVGMSWSADFQKGLAAARSGDYATALREWTPLAKQGDAFFFDSDFDDSTRSYGIGGPGHRIWATPAGHVPETW